MFRKFHGAVVLAFLAVFFVGFSGEASQAFAKAPIVKVHVDISSQSMSVWVNGSNFGNWPVSTGRKGFDTPRGSFTVKRTARVYFSKKYDDAPMPNAVFFYGGYAIHGTSKVRALGRQASHGCIRLHPADAADFYELVQDYGLASTRVTITN